MQTVITTALYQFGNSSSSLENTFAVARSGFLPKLADTDLRIAVVLLGPISFLDSGLGQPFGAALIDASTVWIAASAWRTLSGV
ncbi:MAG: hypothetical protein JO125_07700 [Chloroflexi bacterium]|nr:hypothetical protein [Ktedonobacteraceae bacterium]MBV9707277.1 hypothetical protein [Chloroflexota bacterium]